MRRSTFYVHTVLDASRLLGVAQLRGRFAHFANRCNPVAKENEHQHELEWFLDISPGTFHFKEKSQFSRRFGASNKSCDFNSFSKTRISREIRLMRVTGNTV